MSVYIWLSLITAVAALVSAITALYLGHKERRLIRRLFTETGHEQFGEVLLNHQRQLRRGQEDLSRQQKKLEHLEIESHYLLNQVGLVKYNPFTDQGGNMSFSLALLNNNGDGVVVTSLHSREGIRIYSKKVERFECEQQLMDEEKEAIKRAKRKDS